MYLCDRSYTSTYKYTFIVKVREKERIFHIYNVCRTMYVCVSSGHIVEVRQCSSVGAFPGDFCGCQKYSLPAKCNYIYHLLSASAVISLMLGLL